MRINSRSLILILASAVAVLLIAVVTLLLLPRPEAPSTAAPGLVAPGLAARDAYGALHQRGQIDALRRGVPIDREAAPLPMARVENVDLKRVRGYPMQPPTIPHTIDGYQVDKNANRCMLCHARANADTFQAPPVSVTHYMDRDDQFLATISPRRYFCNQCHVVQTDARPLIANQFKDIDSVLSSGQGN